MLKKLDPVRNSDEVDAPNTTMAITTTTRPVSQRADRRSSWPAAAPRDAGPLPGAAPGPGAAGVPGPGAAAACSDSTARAP
jgi:hypothetical protein